MAQLSTIVQLNSHAMLFRLCGIDFAWFRRTELHNMETERLRLPSFQRTKVQWIDWSWRIDWLSMAGSRMFWMLIKCFGMFFWDTGDLGVFDGIFRWIFHGFFPWIFLKSFLLSKPESFDSSISQLQLRTFECRSIIPVDGSRKKGKKSSATLDHATLRQPKCSCKCSQFSSPTLGGLKVGLIILLIKSLETIFVIRIHPIWCFLLNIFQWLDLTQFRISFQVLGPIATKSESVKDSPSSTWRIHINSRLTQRVS